ncbi:hypothetical protein VPH35_063148 [Triticum aestivum]|uniref:Uncharacterized protein n=1 Tax=Aegilops tauschii TaxID=37682 RepID=M8C550_AEGTA
MARIKMEATLQTSDSRQVANHRHIAAPLAKEAESRCPRPTTQRADAGNFHGNKRQRRRRNTDVSCVASGSLVSLHHHTASRFRGWWAGGNSILRVGRVEDYKVPKNSFLLGVTLRLSESTDIIGTKERSEYLLEISGIADINPV